MPALSNVIANGTPTRFHLAIPAVSCLKAALFAMQNQHSQAVVMKLLKNERRDCTTFATTIGRLINLMRFGLGTA